jgi:hypothetical protein
MAEIEKGEKHMSKFVMLHPEPKPYEGMTGQEILEKRRQQDKSLEDSRAEFKRKMQDWWEREEKRRQEMPKPQSVVIHYHTKKVEEE